MSETYLVGIDGTEASRAAVHLTMTVAAATGASVVAATVHPEPPFVLGRGGAHASREAIVEGGRHDAERLLEPLRGDVADTCTIMADSPAHGLQRLAEVRAVDLVAVGLTHRRGLGRLVPGSVAEHLLYGAPCPVLVVPSGDGPAGVETIAVAYDHRTEARAALDHAVALAQRLGARLTLIAAFQPSLTYGVGGVPTSTYDLEEGGRAALEEVVREVAAGLSVDTTVRVVIGPPAKVIEEAASEGADLLVAGSRGYGPVKSVLLGSVSRHLVDHASCPVLVVPRATGVRSEPAIAVSAVS